MSSSSSSTSDTIIGNWSNTSAFNLDLALKESREWIEAVCQQKFPSDDFQASLKNGLLLCKLINQIKPGIVPKVNQTMTDFAHRENLSFFIKAAKQLGLRDTQLFDTTDIYESKRIRNVAISLYWLGRAARAVSTYKGPQLNLLAFQKMNCSACKKPINDGNYLATLTQQWHTSCAKCCSCHCQLDPKQQFFMEGNNIWCPNCMVGAAGVSNKGPGHGQGHGHSHSNDNQCVGCHGSLEKGYVPDEQDESKKYCTSCICDLCHNPLIGNFNVVNGEKICDDCSCSVCAKPLKDGYFEEGLSKYCQPCLDDRSKKQQAPKSPLTPSTATLHQQPAHQHQHQHAKPSAASAKDGYHECHKPLDNKPKTGKGDRDKFCTPHEKERCCGGCDREVEGQVVQAMDKSWHPQCLKCDKCSKDLTKSGESIKKGTNGNPLCGPCASSGSLSSKCGGCDKPVVGQGLEALDKKWHPQCFQCRSCHKKLDDEFVYVDDQPYCDPCAKNLSQQGSPAHSGASNVTGGWGPNDKCSGCSSPLQGEVTKISKNYWHRGCFKCDQCKTALQTGYFVHSERPFCKGCHDKHEADNAEHTCPKCNKPIIDGAIVQASGRQWHKVCFSCTKCNKQIGDGTTFTRFFKPYCRPCFDSEKTTCAKCRNQIQGEVVEDDTGKTYCKKCAPAPTTHTIYGDRTPGFTIDPRSGKKTIRQ